MSDFDLDTFLKNHKPKKPSQIFISIYEPSKTKKLLFTRKMINQIIPMIFLAGIS